MRCGERGNGTPFGHEQTEPPRTPVTAKQEPREVGRFPHIAYVILGYVARYPEGIHGYRLGRILSRAAHRLPAVRLGQLYRVLRRLEEAGLLECHVASESARLRYRFVCTRSGQACLQEWLTTLPGDTGAPCQEVLERLRFADQIPRAALLRLIDAAAGECSRSLEELASGWAAPAGKMRGGDAYETALEARLAADRCWLEEVRQYLHRSADDCEEREHGHTAGVRGQH